MQLFIPQLLIPDSWDPIFPDERIGGDDRHPLHERLGNEYPVKGVPVKRRQMKNMEGVADPYRQRLDDVKRHLIGDEVIGPRGEYLIEPRLDRDLPATRCAQEQFIIAVRDSLVHTPSQFAYRAPPSFLKLIRKRGGQRLRKPLFQGK